MWKWNGLNFAWTIRLTLSICFSVNFDGFWRWIIRLRRIIHLKCLKGRCSIWTDNSSDFIRLFRRIIRLEFTLDGKSHPIFSAHSRPQCLLAFQKALGRGCFFPEKPGTRKGALHHRIRGTKSLKHSPPGRYSGNSWWGCAAPFSKS